MEAQDVADGHLGFFGGAHVVDRPLDHPLEADGLLQDVLVPVRDHVHLVPEKVLEIGLDLLDAAAAAGEDLQSVAVVQDGIEDMFDAHILVAAALCLAHGES